MNEKPETKDGHMRVANELSEALARTYLSSYESQFLWCLFRKTYGWNKKDDWIALSQIAEMTGMHLSHVSRTKKKLLDRRIVTQTGNKMAFNKYYSQWVRLPKQVSKGNTSIVTQTGNLPPPIQVTDPPPKQAGTIDTITKDILQKTGPEKKDDRDDLQRRFLSVVVEQGWCDIHYADKTVAQAFKLARPDQDEFYRKVKIMLASVRGQRKGLAKKIFHEVAGIVSDRGAMKHVLTSQEIQRRKDWLEETGQKEET